MDLFHRYQQLLEDKPSLRARDAAQQLGVSEAELVACRLGQDSRKLRPDFQAILQQCASLGKVMALTRNDFCVHERHGIYENPEFFSHGAMRQGLFANADIDLRLFLNRWSFVFAVTEKGRHSLQFFAGDGQAIHKIYLTDASSHGAYEALVTQFLADDQHPEITVTAYPAAAAELPDDAIDLENFRTSWANLKDTHDFFPMLRKYKLGRIQALRLIGRPDFARPVANDAARQALEMAASNGCEIMVFVGNPGCIQIHGGPVSKLVAQGSWFNVLDPDFNLHLREDAIAQSWVTRKPTLDGLVTALEFFDTEGGLIATFFGKRKPGQAELPLWRAIVAAIEGREITDAA